MFFVPTQVVCSLSVQSTLLLKVRMMMGDSTSSVLRQPLCQMVSSQLFWNIYCYASSTLNQQKMTFKFCNVDVETPLWERAAGSILTGSDSRRIFWQHLRIVFRNSKRILMIFRPDTKMALSYMQYVFLCPVCCIGHWLAVQCPSLSDTKVWLNCLDCILLLDLVLLYWLCKAGCIWYCIVLYTRMI